MYRSSKIKKYSDMPKRKTKKALTKRFRKTASGKLKHVGAGRGHLLTSKSSKRKRNLRKGRITSKSNEKRLRDLF